MSRRKTTAERWRGEVTEAPVPGNAHLPLPLLAANLPV